MKDPKVVGFSPMFHWTEQKIRCTPNTACSLSPSPADGREAKNAGMVMSVRELLSDLKGSRNRDDLPVHRWPSRARRMITEMDPPGRSTSCSAWLLRPQLSS